MSTWSAINANQILPSELVSAINGIAKLVTDELASLEDTFNLATQLPSLPTVPRAAVAVATAILDTLSALLATGRIHMLVVPISKKIPKAPRPPIPPTLVDLQAALDIELGPTSTAGNDAYADIVTKSGGNAGFFSAFAESLMDVADPNRPQYDDQSDAVAMATLLIGAPTFASIASAASTLELIVRPQGSAGSMMARAVPIPQSLSARVVGASTGTGVGVRLDWEPPKDAFVARYFPGVVVTVKRYAVIRTTSPKAPSARSVLDLFSTQSLEEGLVEGDSTVIAIGSGRNAAYLDAEADPSKPAYYAVSWECAVVEAGSTIVLPFDRLSNVVKVDAKKPSPTQTGTSPDWTATASAIDAFPSVATAARRLIEEARVLLAPASNPTTRLSDAVKLVQGASTRLAARTTELMTDVNRLAEALNRPIPSLYVTQMSSASGGNAFLLAELAKRLNDSSDPTRPPFDHGEYVCGVCFVVGAPRLADLAATIAFFESLFGPADASNPLLGVLDALDTLVTQQEVSVFDPSMTTVADPSSVDPLTGVAPVPTRPAIAIGGEAVASDSPSNAETGATNVTPISDLC